MPRAPYGNGKDRGMIAPRTYGRMMRVAWAERLGMSDAQLSHFPESLLCQLSLCKSDEARRLILFADANEGKDASRALGNREQSARVQKL